MYAWLTKGVRSMDAKKMGAFISEQRKSLGLTQAELAGRLHVTDKAVSRWERGQGFPDFHSIQPLADTLEVTIAEIMRGEKNAAGLSDDAASLAAKNVISLVELKREEYQKIMAAVAAALLLFCILLVDVMGFMGFVGDALPCLGAIAGIALLCIALIRKKRKFPMKAIILWAVILLAIPVILAVLLIVAGMLGVGPVPN